MNDIITQVSVIVNELNKFIDSDGNVGDDGFMFYRPRVKAALEALADKPVPYNEDDCKTVELALSKFEGCNKIANWAPRMAKSIIGSVNLVMSVNEIYLSNQLFDKTLTLRMEA